MNARLFACSLLTKIVRMQKVTIIIYPLAIALQRGNAHAVMVGLSHARAAVSAPLPSSLRTSSALRFKRRRTH